MCHPIAVHGVTVDVEPDPFEDVVHVRVRVRTADRTGVEMEALTAVTGGLPDRDRHDQVPGSGRHHRSGAGRFQDRRQEWGLAPMKAQVIVCFRIRRPRAK